LLTVVTGMAIILVAAAVWYGAIGILGARDPLVVTMVARIPVGGTSSPGPTVTRGPTPRLAPPATPLPGETLLVRLTEAELTEAVRRSTAIESGGVKFDDARVRLRGGRAEVTGQVKGLLPAPVEVQVTGRVEVREGRPFVAVERVEGVGLALPEMAAQQLEQLINSQAVIPVEPGVTVTRIDTTEGAVTVYGRRR
jgi:hypothetical protein